MEEKVVRKVYLITTGYRWTCPICDTENSEVDARKEVTCSHCKKTFKVSFLCYHTYP